MTFVEAALMVVSVTAVRRCFRLWRVIGHADASIRSWPEDNERLVQDTYRLVRGYDHLCQVVRRNAGFLSGAPLGDSPPSEEGLTRQDRIEELVECANSGLKLLETY